jgi:hypothetical protein
VKRKRLKTGDVLEVIVPGGVIYLHYLGKHPDYGDGIAVCPTTFAGRVEVSPELFAASYITFYPASAAVARGMAAIVGHLPSQGLPVRYRRAGARSGTMVETWIIEDGQSEVVKRRLSEEELHLPIVGIWNHAFLIQRVSEGWRPEKEGRDE